MLNSALLSLSITMFLELAEGSKTTWQLGDTSLDHSFEESPGNVIPWEAVCRVPLSASFSVDG